jgi:uncharacterized membrane protein YkoI
MPFRHPLWASLVFVLALQPVAAEEHGHDRAHDHDRARAALESGRVVPLQRILDKVDEDFTGKMIQVELEEKGSHLFYEVKLLTDAGRLLELRYDARSMELLNAAAPDVVAAGRGK